MRNCSFCGEQTRWAEILEDERLLCPACKPCLFFERCLTLTGDFAGRPFLLMPWLREVTRDIFGTLDESGQRQYRDVYLEVGKGNAKTTWCAGLVLYYLATATVSGTEVYSAATAKDQAGIVFRYASQMVQVSRSLSGILKVVPSTKRIIRRDDPTSFYAAISADGDIHDGMAPSFVVRDELHRWRTRKALELNEIMERGMIKRENPMIVDITTAGEEDESPLCWRRHEYARQMQQGLFEDRRFYGRIWAADRERIDSDPRFWKTREARVQANPGHEDRGGYLKDSDLEDLCLKAQNDPSLRSNYLRYHLNAGATETRRIRHRHGEMDGMQRRRGSAHMAGVRSQSADQPVAAGRAALFRGRRSLVDHRSQCGRFCFSAVRGSEAMDAAAVFLYGGGVHPGSSERKQGSVFRLGAEGIYHCHAGRGD